MRDTRRQHTVPRTYLQLFARQRKDDYYVFTYDKYTGKLYEVKKQSCYQVKSHLQTTVY